MLPVSKQILVHELITHETPFLLEYLTYTRRSLRFSATIALLLLKPSVLILSTVFLERRSPRRTHTLSLFLFVVLMFG